MNSQLYYVPGNSRATDVIKGEISLRGVAVADTPSEAVTHLVLEVPCRMDRDALTALLQKLSKDISIFGGFLNREELKDHRCFDLLKDEWYLAQNAAITAYGALQVALEQLPVTLEHCQVLILGWGRIGKCLAPLLRALGANVVIAVRKKEQQAMIHALGYETEPLPLPSHILPLFRVIFNTVPAPVLSEEALAFCRPDCLKIELASQPGIAGDGIIDARGLPGKLYPESSGKLITRTVLRLSRQKEETA